MPTHHCIIYKDEAALSPATILPTKAPLSLSTRNDSYRYGAHTNNSKEDMHCSPSWYYYKIRCFESCNQLCLMKVPVSFHIVF